MNATNLAPLLPHGELQQVFENIWFVQGQVKMPMPFPAKISRSMTIVRNPDNHELTLINSMRLSDQGVVELSKLGRVTNVIRIAGFHGRDDAYYQQQHNARIYAIRGQTYSRKMEVPEDTSAGYMQPDVWVQTENDLPIPNCELKIFTSSSPPEAMLLLKQDGGIIIACDALQNTPKPDRFVNFAVTTRPPESSRTTLAVV